MTIPTKLILLRIVLIPVFLTLFWCSWEFGRMAALIVFAIASITDLFDGVIARRLGQMNTFVKVMDPLADKLLICSALIALVQTGDIYAWFVIIIVCRDFIITAFRLFAASQNIILGAVITGKFNTCFQMLLILFILAGFNFDGVDLIKQILIGVVLILTIVSTAENFIRNKSIVKKILE